MRVFFVGMHNKPGKLPLDSSTMTGKVIDRIISEISVECIKTNLCDIDYFPKDKVLINECNIEWYYKHNPNSKDIVILLGRWVQQNFRLTIAKTLKFTHPAGIYGTKNKEQYILNSIELIKTNL